MIFHILHAISTFSPPPARSHDAVTRCHFITRCLILAATLALFCWCWVACYTLWVHRARSSSVLSPASPAFAAPSVREHKAPEQRLLIFQSAALAFSLWCQIRWFSFHGFSRYYALRAIFHHHRPPLFADCHFRRYHMHSFFLFESSSFLSSFSHYIIFSFFIFIAFYVICHFLHIISFQLK